ncbi:hypothetical protein GF412_00210 [Candidatus Micrarchaeota archaeon]|nr:hypothetical protein [Candidatus Micrarchaeota archaeon]MBD3417398.1 hypothetical protein [Candidatus Micrarchaeota archaeon]
MDFQKIILGMFIFSMLVGVGFPDTSATTDIKSGICELYDLVKSVLVVVIFLLIVAAAIVYAGGQLLGAETRARASVWATSMFIGALIGVLIYVIMPMILNAMMGTSINLEGDCTSWSITS